MIVYFTQCQCVHAELGCVKILNFDHIILKNCTLFEIFLYMQLARFLQAMEEKCSLISWCHITILVFMVVVAIVIKILK